MKLILLFIFFATKLTAQDSLKISGIEAPLPSFSKKFTVDDVQASTDKNDPSTIKINIKGEAKNISFPIKLPFKAEATNPSNSNPLNQAEPSAAVAIEDKDGGIYEVDDKGKAKKIGNKGSELPPIEYKEAARKMNVRLGRATTPKLMFKALASEPLAFDEWQENFKGKSIIEKEYQKIGNDYYVPIKFIPQGMTGKVQVDLNGINKDSLIFKTPNGSIYTLQENNILSIAGAKNGDGIELYAQNKFDSTIIYGKLNIYGYEIKNLKVNLVPVNSTASIDKEKLETELNKIYYPYGVSVSLNVLNKIEDKSWDLNHDGKLDVGETGILNFRTEEMKAVHRLNENKKAEEIYLYLMQTPSKEGVEGDMPLGSQYGFLFGELNARTLSHEIAHGYFQLKHSFDESIALQKSSTNNLMDYASGNALYKYQWDLVHDKGLMISKLWQNDSAGESAYALHYEYVKSQIEQAIKLQYGLPLKDKLTDDDERIAIKIAHYASVYADYTQSYIFLNRQFYASTGKDKILIKEGIYGKGHGSEKKTKEEKRHNLQVSNALYGSYEKVVNSQSPTFINNNGGVYLHGMTAWWEGKAKYNYRYLDYEIDQALGDTKYPTSQLEFDKDYILTEEEKNYILTEEERKYVLQKELKEIVDMIKENNKNSEEIITLKTEIKTIDKENQHIKKEIETTDKEIKEINKEIETIDKEIANLKQKQNDKSRIVDKEKIIEKNKTSIEKNKTSIEKNKTSIEKNKTSIEKNKTSIEKNKTSIEKNKTSILLNIIFEGNLNYISWFNKYQETALEDMTSIAQERVKRGGEVIELGGKVNTIRGIEEVRKVLKGKLLRNYDERQMKMLGVALHQIQDLSEHLGARWVWDEIAAELIGFKIGIQEVQSEIEPYGKIKIIPKEIMYRKAKMIGHSNKHPDGDCGINAMQGEVKDKKTKLYEFLESIIF